MKFIEWLVLLSILVGLNETTVPKTILPNGTTAANNPAGNEDIDGVSNFFFQFEKHGQVWKIHYTQTYFFASVC